MNRFIENWIKQWQQLLRLFGSYGSRFVSSLFDNYSQLWFSLYLERSKRERKLKRVSQQLLLFLVVVIISACGGAAIDHSKLPNSEAPSTDCRIVQHAIGQTCVPHNPQRVVTVVHHILGHLLALGIKPVGSNVRSLEQASGDYLDIQTYMGDKTEGIELLGINNQVNLEKVSTLKPDLILGWEASQMNYSLLSQIAPTIILRAEDVVSKWKEGFTFIAEALGKEKEARQALDKYSQRIEEAKAFLGDRYQNQTISVTGSNGSNMYAFTQNSFSGSILNDLSLQRPEAQRVNATGGAIYNLSEERLEQVIDGDVIFFLEFGQESETTFERLQQRPLWKKLKAAQKGQVYLVNGNTWTGSNLLAADAVIDDLLKYLTDNPKLGNS